MSAGESRSTPPLSLGPCPEHQHCVALRCQRSSSHRRRCPSGKPCAPSTRVTDQPSDARRAALKTRLKRQNPSDPNR